MLALQAQSNQRWQANLRSSSSRSSVLSTPSTASSALSHRSSLSSSSTPSTPSTRRSSDASSHTLAALKASASSSSPATHSRHVSSFSASDLSPLTADTKQAGRTPRRRPAETDHRIRSPPLPPTASKAEAGTKVDEAADADNVDRLIVQKLQHLLQEALHIQQVQAQSHPPLSPPSLPVRPAEERGLTTPAGRASAQPRTSKPTSRRLTLTPAASPPPLPPPISASSPPSSAVPGDLSAEPLSSLIPGFLQRVLALLLLLEKWLMRRLSRLQRQAVDSVAAAVTATTGSLYERWRGRSAALLSSFHQAMHTPVITLHYPAIVVPLIPSYLISTPKPAPPLQATPAPAPLPAHIPLPITLPRTPPRSPAVVPRAPSTPPVDEREVLRSTISQLQLLLREQSTTLAVQGQVAVENAELRDLIAAQEQQITRQQEVIAEVRRELERQVRVGEDGLGVEREGQEEDDESRLLTVEEVTLCRLMGEEWAESNASLIASY